MNDTADTQTSVLIVDDDQIIRESLAEFLRLEGYTVGQAQDYASALEELERTDYPLICTDINMPDRDGLQLLQAVRTHYPSTVVIVMTGYGSIESAVQAMKLGAFDYLTKPIIDDEIRLVIERALQQQHLVRENKQLREQLGQRFNLDNVVGNDYKMLRVFELVEAVADTRTTVLMTGASGTGKSLVARALHQRSSRRDKPFVEVSCGALPDNLLESELFGHVKGSFTGAVADKQGRFLAAEGGTIFLDEINSAPASLQAQLLRVLQEKQFEPVGSNDTITVDVRVVLATNRDLYAEVQAGRFREDLYYRVNVVSIELPNLAERIGDIPLLSEHFLRKYCEQNNRQISGFSEEAMARMQRYRWPGNVRELENVIERAVVLTRNTRIQPDDLPEHMNADDQPPADDAPYTPMSLKQALESPERRIIEAALKANNWNRQETAAQLDINRTTLYKKMKHYGLADD